MFRLVILVCVFVGMPCKPTKWHSFSDDILNDFFGSESNKFENYATYNSFKERKDDLLASRSKKTEVPSDAGSGGGDDKLGYSAGSGLRSIAQGSAEQAHTAVQSQDAAGHQAAYVAKNTLAQAANAASATAQAALAGKQIILQGLEQQHRDAKLGLQGEKQQLQQAQRAALAAEQTSQQAQRHVQVLTAALNVAQATADGAAQTASEAAGELAAQVAMVGAAQQRVDALAEQLHGVRLDFEATQVAAQKAQFAAMQAQNNAAKAAAAAAASSGVNNDGDGHPSKGGVLPVPADVGQTGHSEKLATYINADYDY